MIDPLIPQPVNSELNIEAQVHALVLPSRYVGKFTKGSTTPSVKNVERWIAVNTAPVTVTDFKDGQEGQELKVLGDGQTTVANNTKIVTKSGAATLLAANTLYEFVRMNGIWYQS